MSRHWMLKVADLVDRDTVADEQRYLDDIPEMAQIRAIFELARIEYGRIDYARKDGHLVVWEINEPGLRAAPRKARLLG